MSNAHRCALLLLVVGMLSPLRTAHARQGTVVGIVEDSAGAPILAASVMVAGSNFGVATDVTGRFRFPSLPVKVWTLEIRRLGFAPVTTEVDVRNRDTVSLSITLIPAAYPIAPVVVSETDITPRLREVGFEHRRKNLTTVPARHFVTRAQLEKQNPTRMTQVLDRIGGRARGCTNPVMYVDGARRAPAPADPPPPPPTVRRAGQPRVATTPSLISPGMSRGTPIDDFSPSWIEGLEVYVGPAQIPLEYRATGRDIGCVLLIWTRVD